MSCPLVFISFHQCVIVFFVCSQEQNKLCQLVMFEAAKRYVRSLEDSVWGTEKYKLIEALSTAMDKSEVGFCTQAHVFEPGTLRLELLRKPGYLGCEAYNWLAQHGGIEGEYELSTISMVQDERELSAIRCLQLKLLHELRVPADQIAIEKHVLNEHCVP